MSSFPKLGVGVGLGMERGIFKVLAHCPRLVRSLLLREGTLADDAAALAWLEGSPSTYPQH
jgi:hypothetical protein